MENPLKRFHRKNWRREQWLRRVEELRVKFGMRYPVLAVDMDGVLCKGEMFDSKSDPEPIHENIRLINEISLKAYIIIHTARRQEMAISTLRWLERHNVRYHAIRFDKLPADLYIDDKAFNPGDLDD